MKFHFQKRYFRYTDLKLMPPVDYYQTDVIYQGDVLKVLKKLPSGFIRCCVTSPPYYGLRDYGTAIWIGGDEKCDHKHNKKWMADSGDLGERGHILNANEAKQRKRSNSNICHKCGAKRIDMQLGLEKTPELYIKKMVHIFRELRRVLTDDGTLWLNIGDSYAASGRGGGGNSFNDKSVGREISDQNSRRAPVQGLKPKDLIGIPWMLAFALRKDGWYLRSDIIWHKQNPMPESVTDRPTKAHEYIFLLTKSEKYYYDHVAIRTPIKDVEDYERRINAQTWDNKNTPDKLKNGIRPRKSGNIARKYGDAVGAPEDNNKHQGRSVPWKGQTANKKSVWTVSTKPFAEAHFATFPQDLIIDCIKAGTSEKGKCGQCGKPWIRLTEKELKPTYKASFATKADARDHAADKNDQSSNRVKDGHKPGYYNEFITTGWRPTCECNGRLEKKTYLADPEPVIDEATGEITGYSKSKRKIFYEYHPSIPMEQHPVEPDIVADIFAGAGTTPLVAKKLLRHTIGIELNPKYIDDILLPRLSRELGMFNTIKKATI